VDENAFNPLFSIILVRVEIPCTNEDVVSSIGTRECEFILAIDMGTRVDSKVAEGD